MCFEVNSLVFVSLVYSHTLWHLIGRMWLTFSDSFYPVKFHLVLFIPCILTLFSDGCYTWFIFYAFLLGDCPGCIFASAWICFYSKMFISLCCNFFWWNKHFHANLLHACFLCFLSGCVTRFVFIWFKLSSSPPLSPTPLCNANP